jgi:uncharacterized protein YjbI with pentapeptide repeats
LVLPSIFRRPPCLKSLPYLRKRLWQAKWDAKNAKHQHSELIKRRPFLERVLSTAQFTIVLALATLLAQAVQFTYTAYQTRKAEKIKEWKDAVNDVSFDGDSKSASAAVELETFFDDDDHKGEAKAVVATIVPGIRNRLVFDHLFNHLKEVDGWNDPAFRTKVGAQEISVDFMDFARPFFKKRDPVPQPLSTGFRRALSKTLEDDSDPVDLATARWREYQIDTATQYLIDFWGTHKTRSDKEDDKEDYDSVDLRNIILYLDDDKAIELRPPQDKILDFSGADFTNAYLHRVHFGKGTDLRHANFTDADLGEADLSDTTMDGAVVDGANFDNVPKPTNSSWKGVEWWRAEIMSDALCKYLKEEGKGDPLPSQSINDPCLKKTTSASTSR